MAGLYFHIPFCKRVCAYCDFYKSARVAELPRVLERMSTELCEQAGWLGVRELQTIYFGGGTPSLVEPASLAHLIHIAATVFETSRVEEITVEANPDDLTSEWLAGLAQTRVNRLSIGIQSLDDAALRFMNRRHTAAQAVSAVKNAQAAGFGNITVDVIFGVPGFSVERTIEGILSLGVPHISAYHLTIEPATAFGRRRLQPVGDEQSEREYLHIHRALTAAGFEHYEVSNYALPGFRARHNSAYWNGSPYLGIGPSAHSFNGTERRWSLPDLDNYPTYESEILTPRDRRNEYIMTGLRTAEGILLPELPVEAEKYIRTGRLQRTGSRLKIPPEHFLVSDQIISDLFETTVPADE